MKDPIVIIAHDDNFSLSVLNNIEKHCEEKGLNVVCFKAGLDVKESDIDHLCNVERLDRKAVVYKLIHLINIYAPEKPTDSFEHELKELASLVDLKTKEAEQLEKILCMDDKPRTRGDHKSKKQNFRNFSRKHNF